MPREPARERIIGRYALHQEIASGGMATVHLGRLLGQVGFSRTVAIKRLHAQFAKDPEFVAMFLDEARLAGRIQHPNVVSTLDVVATHGELFLVMEYVHGESLSQLLRRLHRKGEPMPLAIVSSILCGALHGLHAAHEARSEQGAPLGIVHRDVSPHNIVVGLDGIARVLDFGVAKAIGRMQTTREGEIKGKLAYMAPEQLRGGPVDRRVDVYAAAIVLWEALTGRPLFHGDNEGMVIERVLRGADEPPSRYRAGLAPSVDALVMRALEREPDARWPTARALAAALEDALGVASPRRVGELVDRLGGESLASRAKLVEQIEAISSGQMVLPELGCAEPPGSPDADPTDRDCIVVPDTLPASKREPELATEAPITVPDPPRAGGASLSPEPATPASTSAASSQVSSISVSRPAHAGRGASRRVRVAGLVAALALLGLGGLFSGLMLRDRSSAGAGPVLGTATQADTDSAPPAGSETLAHEPATASAQSPASPTSSAASAATPPATTHARTTANGKPKAAVKFTRPD